MPLPRVRDCEVCVIWMPAFYRLTCVCGLGIQRDDIRPGLRITSHRKRVLIAFEVDADQVAILGVFYGGQDYETSFQQEKDEED